MIGTGEETAGIFSSLAAEGYSVGLHGFSALDKYLELPALPFLWARTNADISALARLIENLRFPGPEIADGAVDNSDGTCYFRCLDGDKRTENIFPFPLLSFGYDLRTRRFQDPLGVYPLLREMRNRKADLEENPGGPGGTDADFFKIVVSQNINFREAGQYRIIMACALLLARYGLWDDLSNYFTSFIESRQNNYTDAIPCPEAQRAFLSCLMVSAHPDRGLAFLKKCGFLDELWPELACLNEVDHSKEYHPEGNVWNHTLETFRHRKAGTNGAFDLRLSLGLLLHDAGKPISGANGNHRFDGHAELGARAAMRFLRRLGFEPSLVEDVFFLIKNHMLPAALKRLPLARTGDVMASPLFPALMELYRCDESSSFKGLDGYYENSAAYQSYLRNIRNPYRSADGKKIGRRAAARKI